MSAQRRATARQAAQFREEWMAGKSPESLAVARAAALRFPRCTVEHMWEEIDRFVSAGWAALSWEADGAEEFAALIVEVEMELSARKPDTLATLLASQNPHIREAAYLTTAQP